jgi:hypothetical protein
MTWPGYPIHFEHRRYHVVGAPGLGADSGDVLEWLGFSRNDVTRLRQAGIIADAPPGASTSDVAKSDDGRVERDEDGPGGAEWTT